MASVAALEGSRRELSPDELHSVIFATTGQPSIDSFPLMFTSSILSLSLLASSPAQHAIDLLRERIQQCSPIVLPPKCDLHLEVEAVRSDRYIISAHAGGSTCDNPGGSTLLGWFAVDGKGVVEIHHPSAAGDEHEFEPLNCSTQEDD